MTVEQHSSPVTADVRKVLGAFYKTVDVMKSARSSESKTMSVWADDMKAVEDVMFFLETLRDNAPAQSSLQKLSDPHPHWSVENKNENYPKTVEEWDPHKDPVGQQLTLAVKRIRMAIDRDDPRAPDEMALVSRWDLMTLVHDWWHKCAVFDIWREERKKAKAQVQAQAIASTDAAPVATASARGELPTRETIAREVRRAMLDNPTGDGFKQRANLRDKIADQAADAILALLAQGGA